MAERNEIGHTVDYVSGRNRYMGYLISLSKCKRQTIRPLRTIRRPSHLRNQVQRPYGMTHGDGG